MKFVPVEAMRSVVGHALWQWYGAQAGEDGWPPKQRFRPEELPARILPSLGLVDVEREPFRIYYRLVGSDIAASFGRRHIQGYLDTLGLEQEADLVALYRHTLAANRPLFLAGVQRLDGQEFSYEGGALPLGAPDDLVRRFIIFENYLNTEAWRAAVRQRHYRPETDAD